MKIENDDDRLLYIAAFRYALGRRTYMPSVIVGKILEAWDEFTEHDKSLFKKEIQEAIERGCAGDECDIQAWRRILER